MLARSGFLHVENVFGRQRRHRALQPAAIERVIGIGSKTAGYTAVNIGNSHILKKMLKISFFLLFGHFSGLFHKNSQKFVKICTF